MISQGFVSIYLLYSKDKVLNMFKIFKNKLELQLDSKIKCLRIDKGGEYFNPHYFQEMGIVHETTTGYALQSNGVAKRENRALQKWLTPCYPTRD